MHRQHVSALGTPDKALLPYGEYPCAEVHGLHTMDTLIAVPLPVFSRWISASRMAPQTLHGSADIGNGNSGLGTHIAVASNVDKSRLILHLVVVRPHSGVFAFLPVAADIAGDEAGVVAAECAAVETVFFQ